ncbi:MAG: anaerobic ribonucleoside-triphosphate reductase activating protein [Alphaproteobacteria bacterium]|nr:anaerobic ribonucleoside-triphosphate reductase activating protein [Alphaproteobacteria bacterium]
MPKIYDITPFSLLDYPQKIACIVWIAGCNMRCVFCHNPAIVQSHGEKEESEVLSFLKIRQGKLDAVVFSGGEATLYENLPDLMRKIKEMGFLVKLDTNGTRPTILARLLKENLLDYVAMDYKTTPEKMEKLVGTNKHAENIEASLELLIKAAITFEVRTTVYTPLTDETDINAIIRHLDNLSYKGTYYIQNAFSFGEKTIGNIAETDRAFEREKLIPPKNFTLAFRNF